MRPQTPLVVTLALLLTGCASMQRATDKSWNAMKRGANAVNPWKKPPPIYPPEAPREFRAAWVATVANIDWPSKPGLSTAKQIEEMHAILEKAEELNLNAIILQVRPAADAIYASDLEPWSEYLTGEQGLPPANYYDPLSTWVTEAHRRGIELHAWFNPYRARHSGARSPNAPNHVSQSMPEVVRKFNKWEWLDPAEPRASEHTLAVVLDVVERYDIDGVHLDDYFYPYAAYLKAEGSQTAQDFPDDPAWQRYQQSGGTLSRGDWRRENVNRMIHDLYVAIKTTKPHVKFGVSPFGIARPGVPPEVKSSFNQYEELYADAQLWLNNGWIDYWTPQLYWRVESDQPFDKLLQWWAGENTHNRHLWPGLITSSANKTETGWSADEIVRQIQVTRETPGASGHVHFSMIALLQNRAGVSEALKNGPYASASLIPATPWLTSTPPPGAPAVQADIQEDGSVLVSWASEDMDPPETWGVWARQGGEWHFSVYPQQIRSVAIRPRGSGETAGAPIQAVAVTAVDRLGNASPPSPALEIVPRRKPKRWWWPWQRQAF